MRGLSYHFVAWLWAGPLCSSVGNVGYLSVDYLKRVGLCGGIIFGLCAGVVIDVRDFALVSSGRNETSCWVMCRVNVRDSSYSSLLQILVAFFNRQMTLRFIVYAVSVCKKNGQGQNYSPLESSKGGRV